MTEYKVHQWKMESVNILINGSFFSNISDDGIHSSDFVSGDVVLVNSTVNGSGADDGSPGFSVAEHVQIILPYAVILLLGVLGNVLVIVTLAQNKRMRTVTNVFLLNLAISDLLLGVLCMPFTLAGVLLRAFIFGEVMCRMIPFLQAASVSVSSWSLVAMSIERFFAICHPLKSRRWQTVSHAKRMIILVWVGSVICMLPIAVLSELQPLRGRSQKFKCRERWPSDASEKIFNILIDVFLFLIPLVIMIVTYSIICFTLWKALRSPITAVQNGSVFKTLSVNSERTSVLSGSNNSSKRLLATKSLSAAQTNKSVTQKRVIKMLILIIVEFFISWAPLYIINTISLFDPMLVYEGLGYHGIGFFQLLAYSSSCCNPITYCFMNSKFRQNFIAIFGCRGPTIAVGERSTMCDSRNAVNLTVSRKHSAATTAFG